MSATESGMLCCAFAAFILSQIVFAFDSVRERVFGLAPLASAPSASSAWRLGDPVAVPVKRGPLARAALAFALSSLVAGSAYALTLRAPDDSALHAFHPSIWCSSSSAPLSGGE